MEEFLAKDAVRDAEFARDALPFMDDVYRFALSLTRNAADADDIVQETFLRAFRSWHTFQPGSDARRWLFTICRNAFLRAREKSRHEVDMEDGDAETLAAVRLHADMLNDGQKRHSYLLRFGCSSKMAASLKSCDCGCGAIFATA